MSIFLVWFTRQPEPIEGYFGQHYCLMCKAEGLGNITYLWLKSSTKDGRKDPVKKSKTVSIDGGTLTFQALGQNDWGYYTCQAENDQNHIDSRTVQVSVGPQTRNGRGAYMASFPIQMRQSRYNLIPRPRSGVGISVVLVRGIHFCYPY